MITIKKRNLNWVETNTEISFTKTFINKSTTIHNETKIQNQTINEQYQNNINSEIQMEEINVTQTNDFNNENNKKKKWNDCNEGYDKFYSEYFNEKKITNPLKVKPLLVTIKKMYNNFCKDKNYNGKLSYEMIDFLAKTYIHPKLKRKTIFSNYDVILKFIKKSRLKNNCSQLIINLENSFMDHFFNRFSKIKKGIDYFTIFLHNIYTIKGYRIDNEHNFFKEEFNDYIPFFIRMKLKILTRFKKYFKFNKEYYIIFKEFYSKKLNYYIKIYNKNIKNNKNNLLIKKKITKVLVKIMLILMELYPQNYSEHRFDIEIYEFFLNNRNFTKEIISYVQITQQEIYKNWKLIDILDFQYEKISNMIEFMKEQVNNNVIYVFVSILKNKENEKERGYKDTDLNYFKKKYNLIWLKKSETWILISKISWKIHNYNKSLVKLFNLKKKNFKDDIHEYILRTLNKENDISIKNFVNKFVNILLLNDIYLKNIYTFDKEQKYLRKNLFELLLEYNDQKFFIGIISLKNVIFDTKNNILNEKIIKTFFKILKIIGNHTYNSIVIKEENKGLIKNISKFIILWIYLRFDYKNLLNFDLNNTKNVITIVNLEILNNFPEYTNYMYKLKNEFEEFESYKNFSKYNIQSTDGINKLNIFAISIGIIYIKKFTKTNLSSYKRYFLKYCYNLEDTQKSEKKIVEFLKKDLKSKYNKFFDIIKLLIIENRKIILKSLLNNYKIYKFYKCLRKNKNEFENEIGIKKKELFQINQVNVTKEEIINKSEEIEEYNTNKSIIEDYDDVLIDI